MITGKIKPNYNNFEINIIDIIGEENSSGMKLFFGSCLSTFSKCIKNIINEKSIFLQSIKNEQDDIKESMLKSYINVVNPNIQIFYSSLFIATHSQLEATWKVILELYNKDLLTKIKRKNLNNRYFTADNSQDCTKIFLDFAVEEFNILFLYNFIRNGLVHSKNETNDPSYATFKKDFHKYDIKNIKIIENDGIYSFEILNMHFCSEYMKIILKFLQRIIVLSVDSNEKKKRVQ